MIKILLSGICGKMGQHILGVAAEDPDVEITAGFDMVQKDTGVPVYSSFNSIKEKPDVIIDFSRPGTLDAIASYAETNKIPVVLATTGYNESETEKIKRLSEKVPVFFSANMSLGISLVKSLIRKAADVLGTDFDIEIIEKHHNMKADAPSGTALALADVIRDGREYSFGRTPQSGRRTGAEIGIHAVRGGTVVGEHEVGFYGNDEIIKITHTALSRKVFAAGAVRAAKFICGRNTGLYSMEDML